MAGDAAVTVSMVQVALGVGGLLITGAFALWCLFWFIDKRREAGEGRLRSEADRRAADAKDAEKALHARISTVRDECVRREDYHEDRRRMEGILHTISSDIRDLGKRIDTAFTPVRHGAD